MDETLSAEVARDEAIDRVGRSAWFEVALTAAEAVVKREARFTTDDVLKENPTLEACPELRVLGAAMRTLQRQGLVVAGSFTGSDRVRSHGRPKRLWHSVKR
jgi:hypothetical protein